MSLGEVGAVHAGSYLVATPENLDAKVSEWRRHRSASFASDLLASAILAEDYPDAIEAARFILSTESQSSQAARLVAKRVLDPQSFDVGESALLSDEALYRAVASARKRTREDLRNALAWTDLSLAYASLGFVTKAIRSMELALALAPTNRHVLRSFSRLLVHAGDPDRAIAELRHAPNLSTDPWLLAAEVAVSDFAERRSAVLKQGIAVISQARHHAFQITELASAVGTIDWKHGDRRGAKNHFRTALEAPTGNSVAQASWVSRESGLVTLAQEHLETPRSFEAQAREYLQHQDWEESLGASILWMQDEPFSSAPALFSSYIASVILERWGEALAILDQASLANPTQWEVLNNTAFCYASMNQLSKATEYFIRLDADIEDGRRHGTYLATRGLIAFRSGDLKEGRSSYEAALTVFAKHDLQSARALGAYFLAREEVLARSSLALEALHRANDLARTATATELPFLLRRLSENVNPSGANP